MEIITLNYVFFDYFNTEIILRCMLNSTEKLQINQFLSYLKCVPGALFSVNLIKFNDI